MLSRRHARLAFAVVVAAVALLSLTLCGQRGVAEGPAVELRRE